MHLIRKQYDREYFESPAYKEARNSQRDGQRLEEILKLRRGGRLFEIGCGSGAFLGMAEKYFHVEGIDHSAYAINSIRGALRRKVSLGNIEADELFPERYDVVVAFNVLEHLHYPSTSIQKIFRSLKTGGIFFGSVPHRRGPVGLVHAAITDLFDHTHISNLPAIRWHTFLKKAGFERIRFFGEVMVGRNRSFYIRRRLWRYIAFNLMFMCIK